MNLQDCLTAVNIRPVKDYPPVKAAGTKQGRVKYIRPVSRRQNNHAGIGVETIHLHQNLVEGLLPLIMAAAQPGATVTANSINLINEDNAGGIAFRLVKEVTHSGSTDTDKHLDEFAAADREEGYSGFTGYCPGQ